MWYRVGTRRQSGELYDARGPAPVALKRRGCATKLLELVDGFQNRRGWRVGKRAKGHQKGGEIASGAEEAQALPVPASRRVPETWARNITKQDKDDVVEREWLPRHKGENNRSADEIDETPLPAP